MLYFVKRNKRINEYKMFHDRLDRLTKSTFERIIQEGKSNELITFLSSKNVAFPTTESEIDNFKEALKIVTNDLKRFEPYESRIDFSIYKDIFNFENYIYKDKYFKYNSISRFNKRLMPDFISSVFSELISNGILTKDIRRNIEQYLFAIMSDMDYINISNTLDFINDFNESKNVFIIIGSMPTIFSNSEKESILSERCDIFFKLTKQIKFEGDKIDVLVDKELNTGGVTHHRPINLRHHTFEENKQTARNIQDMVAEQSTIDSNYNLVIVSSSFNLLKCAIEIEKLIQRQKLTKPNNILLVGGTKIYDKIKKPIDKRIETSASTLAEISINKKKVKSLIYEIIIHNLDRNAIK